MADFAAPPQLDAAFETLLGDLSNDWDTADIAYVRDIVVHGEYQEALENLLALADGNDREFTPDQVLHMQALADNLGTNISSLHRSLASNGGASRAADFRSGP